VLFRSPANRSLTSWAELRPGSSTAPRSVSRVSGALAEHIEALCAAHGIALAYGGRGRAEVRRRGRERHYLIRVPPIRGQVSYFVALHEIGHLVGPGRSGRRLEKEAAAWMWALANSRVAPTDATRRRLGAKLRSYVTWAEQRRHRQRPPVLPPSGSEFWSLLRYLEA